LYGNGDTRGKKLAGLEQKHLSQSTTTEQMDSPEQLKIQT